MSDLAEAIREHLTAQPFSTRAGATFDAVLAVVEKCEEIRSDHRARIASERAVADEVERVIAEALGLG